MNMINNANIPSVGSATFTGVRLYINGKAFPDVSISKGSYVFRTFKDVRTGYTDASGRFHTEYYQHKRVIIKFSIRERDMSEQKQIAPFFEDDDVTIVYWDDVKCSYQTDVFKHEDIEWNHANSIGSIMYSSTEIELFSK